MSDKLEAIYIPQLSIFSRYGLYDRMGDGYCDPPNRREWSFDTLYDDWKTHGFFNVFRDIGFITVSYNGSPYIDFVPTAEDANRHQALTLSSFLASCYANAKAIITSPHEQGGEFSATYQQLECGDVIYTTINDKIVQFHFDKTRPSQF
jgi:hypothetical protein